LAFLAPWRETGFEHLSPGRQGRKGKAEKRFSWRSQRLCVKQVLNISRKAARGAKEKQKKDFLSVLSAFA